MARTFVFIACSGGGAVDTLALDPATGALEHLSRAEGLAQVSTLALDPAGTLYAGVNSDPRRTAALALDPGTGAATPGPTIAVPASTCFIALTPDRRGIFSASYHEGLMVGYSAPKAAAPGARAAGEADAAPHADAGRFTEYRSGPNTHSAVPSPDGRFVYTTSLGADRISWFPIQATGEAHAHNGAVQPAGSVAAEPGSGPRHLRHSADGTRVYVLHELSGDVAVYSREAGSGALDLLQRVSSVEGLGLGPGIVRSAANPGVGEHIVWCADLRLTPDGRFLYATERTTSTIAAFAVGSGSEADGRLTFLRRTETEAQPRGIAVDPSGRWLLACGERSDHVTAYAIDAEGSLEAVSRAETAGGPLWIECWEPARA